MDENIRNRKLLNIMADKIIKWNDSLLTWNGKYIRSFIAIPPSPDPWPTEGLIGRWPLQSDLNDTTGNGYHFTMNTGSASYSAGLLGNALNFSPTAVPQMNNSTALSVASNTGTFSAAFWMDVTANGAGFQLTPFQLVSTGFGPARYDFYPDESPKRITIYRAAGGADKTGATITAMYQNWRFMCVNYNGSSFYLYSDNAEAGKYDNSADAGTCTNLLINYAANSNNRGTGLIQFAYLYDHDLTSDERTTLYNSGTPI